MIVVQKSADTSVSILDGRHEIISDISLEQGGKDAGMDPHELIEAALGACTTLTLEMYAKRKNWNISGMIVEVKILSEGKATNIERKITFGQHQTEEEKKKLLIIADKCPIHELLVSQASIQTVANI